jgi:1,4-dihydroxy-2-naphthoate octaprenyltransferase/chlorophyll synthase
MALGQVLGVLHAGRFSAGAAFVGALFTVADGVFIVLLNDWADRDVDAVKRRMFPASGSPKTIPDGLLRPAPVLAVALVAGASAILVGAAGAAWLDRPWLGVAAVACVGIFVAYSLPPVALNYRGGGEFLEAAGVGFALPWFNAYAQSGSVRMPGVAWLLGFAVLSFASAVASGLSDEASDAEGGKHTFTTLLGNRAARRLVEGSLLLGGALWAATPWFLHRTSLALAVLPALLVVVHHGRLLLRASPHAVTGAWNAHRDYKGHLHRVIRDGALVLGGALVALHVVLA